MAEIENYDDYLMYLYTVQGTSIKTLAEALKEVLVDVNLHFNQGGLKIQDMDPSQVSFVFLELLAEEFEEFYCPNPLAVGVNMIALHKLLKTIGNTDTVSIFVTKEAPDKLGIRIQNKKQKISNNITYNLMDVDMVQLDIPDIDYDAIITMPCGTFQKYCRELATLDNFVNIRANLDGVFSLEAAGTIGTCSIEIAESNEVEGMGVSIETVDGPDFSSDIGTFSLKFLNLFCKSSSLCPAIELYMKADYPLIIVYRVASLGTCKYCLLPHQDIRN